jgi:type II secretory pathway pseudopilin PulG
MRKGFTLVETIVYMGISSVILTSIIFSMYYIFESHTKMDNILNNEMNNITEQEINLYEK